MDEQSGRMEWPGEIARAARSVFEYTEQRRSTERREERWRMVKRGIYIAIIGSIALFIATAIYDTFIGDPNQAPSKDSVALISITGEISPTRLASADNIVPLIEKACKASKVKIVAFDINSPGGSPTEAERIATAIDQCSPTDGPHKPVYAIIGSLGASAAYLIAMHTDTIVASRYALVGSVGAIIRYVDASDAAHRLGLSEQVFRSGPLKGGPSNLSPTSPEDARINQDVVETLGQVFVRDALEARGKRLKVSAEDLQTGRIWTSEVALALGLVDELGVLEDLKASAFKDLTIAEYHPRPSFSKLVGAEDLLRNVMSDLMAPSVQ